MQESGTCFVHDAQPCPEGFGASPSDRMWGELAEGSEKPQTKDFKMGMLKKKLKGGFLVYEIHGE